MHRGLGSAPKPALGICYPRFTGSDTQTNKSFLQTRTGIFVRQYLYLYCICICGGNSAMVTASVGSVKMLSQTNSNHFTAQKFKPIHLQLVSATFLSQHKDLLNLYHIQSLKQAKCKISRKSYLEANTEGGAKFRLLVLLSVSLY